MSNSFKISLFTANGIMTKTFGLEDGKLVKHRPGLIAEGTYQVRETTLAKLESGLKNLNKQQALGLGTPGHDKGKIVTASEHEKMGSPSDPIPRSKDHFIFHKQPTVMLFDIDGIAKPIDAVLSIMGGIIPGFQEAEKLIVPSSSSGLYLANKLLNDSTSAHVYVVVKDGTLIPHAMEVIFKRLWIAEHGHIEVSRAGSLLIRSLIDASVGKPERIIYEALPILQDGITQNRPDPEHTFGEMLDLSLLPDLTRTEAQEYERSVDKAKSEKQPEADSVAASYDEKQIKDLVKKGSTNEQAQAAIKARRYGVLSVDDILYLNRADTLPVRHITKAHHGQACCDPLEPAYNNWHSTVAMIFVNDDGSVVVNSNAHGGGVYRVESKADNWPDPLPIKVELPPVEILSDEMIPEPFRAWALDASDRMQVPPDYIMAPLLVVCGSVIGTSCRIRPKQKDDWAVTPNQWGGIVGPPSLLKTPALNEAVNKTVGRLEAAARDEYVKSCVAHEGKAMVSAAKVKALKADIEKAAKQERIKDYKGKKPADLVEELQVLQSGEVPTERRYKTNDCSIEKLVELLNQNPRGLLYFRDELIGLFKRMERVGNEQDRALFLEAWNGDGSHTDDRIGRGTVRTDNLCISLLGAIQPDKIAGYLHRAIHEGDNDGFVQRLQLMVFPNPVHSWTYRDRWPDTDAKNRAYEVIERLAEMEFDGDDGPYLRFSPAGQEVFKQWLTWLQTEKLTNQDEQPVMLEHLAKYRSLMPSLAQIFHLIEAADVDQQPGPVSDHAAKMAAEWCQYLESHARRIYSLALNTGHAGAARLAEKIQGGKLGGKFTRPEVVRKKWAMLTKKNHVQEAIDCLLDEGWLREILPTSVDNRWGRPAAITYEVNPKIKIRECVK